MGNTCGALDMGELAVNAASREVLEETGYEISEPKFIYRYNPLNGISDKVILVYKAGAVKKAGTFNIIEVTDTQWISKSQIQEMIMKNEIRCGVSLIGLLLVLFCGL